jgi:hypothetical protein
MLGIGPLCHRNEFAIAVPKLKNFLWGGSLS